jgi:uncharacterized membrane protein YwzB
MKKIIAICGIFCIGLNSKAQGPVTEAEGQRQFVVNATFVAVLYLVSSFILKVVKGIQDYRLKNKMLEKGLSEELVQQFLQPPDHENKNQTIRICFILAGIGIGLALTSFFKPDMIMSIALSSMTIAAGFLAYYIYLKKTD